MNSQFMLDRPRPWGPTVKKVANLSPLESPPYPNEGERSRETTVFGKSVGAPPHAIGHH